MDLESNLEILIDVSLKKVVCAGEYCLKDVTWENHTQGTANETILVAEGVTEYPFEYEAHFNKSVDNYNPRNLKLFIYSCWYGTIDESPGRYPCYGYDGPCDLCIIGALARLYQNETNPEPWSDCSEAFFLTDRIDFLEEVQFYEKVEHLPNGTVVNTVEYLAITPIFEFIPTTDDPLYTTEDYDSTTDDTTDESTIDKATKVVNSETIFVTIFFLTFFLLLSVETKGIY